MDTARNSKAPQTLHHLRQVAHWLGWLALGVLVAALLYSVLRLLLVASADSRVIGTFSSDEEFLANGLERMITRKSLNYGFWWYPGLFMNVSLPLDLLLQLMGIAAPAAHVIAPRLVTAFGYASTVVLTAMLARELTRSWFVSLTAAVLLATTADIYMFALIAHPDSLQLALLLLSLWFLVRHARAPSPRMLYGATIAAALATATKYAGGFLLPVLILGAWWARTHAGETRRDAWHNTWRHEAPRAALVFAVSFIIAAPSYLFSLPPFYRVLQHHNRATTFGWLVAEKRSSWHWLNIMAEPDVLSAPIMALFVISLLLLAWYLWPKRSSLAPLAPPCAASTLRGYALLAIYTCLYVGLLLWRTRLFELRYLYPAIPTLIILALGVVWHTLTALPRALRYLALGCLTATLALVLPQRLAALQTIHAARAELDTHPCLALGRWLQAHAATDSTILYDRYSYVPRDYAHARSTWGMTNALLTEHKPSLIITNGVIGGRYLAAIDAKSWRQGAEEFLASRQLYTALNEQRLPYRLVLRLDTCNNTRVYAATNGASTPAAR